MQNYKKEFIEFAVQQGALKFGEFALKSGRKSPYFFNAGDFKTGASLAKLAKYYAGAVAEHIHLDNVVLYGPAYKGIPLVAITAVKLAEEHQIDYPISYNRKEKKDHGEGGNIVGTALKNGDNVVAIEDVITAGTAIGETKAILAENGGATLRAVIIAVDRCEVKNEGDSLTTIETVAKKEGIEVYPIVTIHEILEHLYKKEINGKVYVGDVEKAAIERYLAKYGTLSN